MKTRDLALASLFAALTAICAQMIVSIGAVPVSLSLLPVLIGAALLPVHDAVMSMAAYILMGLAGLPVFSGFSGGPGKVFGVTGGYIIGYLPCVITAALLCRKSRGYIGLCVSLACGVLTCYMFGTLWFMILRHCSLRAALLTCVIPFLPFDFLKVMAAALLAEKVYPVLYHRPMHRKE